MEFLGLSHLGSSIVFGALCAIVANSRGRNVGGWFVLGFFLTCISLIILVVLPDLKEEEGRHHRLTTENRRLREQAKKDRHVAERRHVATQERLDVHDQSLDIDTSRMVEGLAPDVLPAPQPATAKERQSFERSLWFYLVGEEQFGPVPFAEMKKVWREGLIGSASYVWREGMADWKPLSDLPALEGEFRA